MNAEIYYFSGTGNSLIVAKDIAEKTSGKLISIASIIKNKSIKTNANIIGIVFPLYFIDNYPLIIEQFIQKIDDIQSKYIFAICTYGGASFSIIKKISSVITSSGGELKAGFTINMPQNTFKKPVENKNKLYAKCKKKVESIYKYIKFKRGINR